MFRGEGWLLGENGCDGLETSHPGSLQVNLKITLAAPFRHMRKEQLRKREFIFFLAIDRKWMNKDQAQELLSRAVRKGLLIQKGDLIHPTFDLSAITIPLGFKPSPEMLNEQDAVEALLERIAGAKGVEMEPLVAEMNSLIHDRFDGHLRAEAAAVILAQQYGVSFADCLDDLKSRVLEKK